MKKYPSIRYPGDEETHGIFADGTLHILEKIDGANFRFKYHNGGLYCGSRNVEFVDKSGDSIDLLPIEEVNEQFRHVIQYLYTVIDMAELSSVYAADDESRPVFFGEAMHVHSIDYDAWEGQEPAVDGDFPNFIGFDIWDPAKEKFLHWDLVSAIYGGLGLETVPVVETTPATGFDPDEYDIPQSAYREADPDVDTEFDRDGLAEGVVLRNDDTGHRAKLVHDSFREKNAIAFNHAKKAQSEAGRFVATYVTDARVRKQVHKLVDEGDWDEPEMPMMPELVPAVMKDVMAEEGWTILQDDIDLTEETKGEIRSKASGKCATVLQTMVNQ